jgi:hypothetical protein
MEDDFKAIIKIPYWISVPKTLATASEAATLTFLRSKGVLFLRSMAGRQLRKTQSVLNTSLWNMPLGWALIHVGSTRLSTRNTHWLPASSILKRSCLLYHSHLQAVYISSEISRLTTIATVSTRRQRRGPGFRNILHRPHRRLYVLVWETG